MLDFSKSENKLDLYYALPAFALAFPTIPVFVLLPTFYAETVGLGLATVGWVMFALRLFDVVTDPLLGMSIDRIPAYLGRRKLPFALGGVVAAVGLVFLFSPDEGADYVYLLIWGSVLYLGWTATQIPYLSWPVALHKSYLARNQSNAFREIAGLLGTMVISFSLLFLSDMEATSRFQILAWFTVLVGAVLFVPVLRFLPDKLPETVTPSLAFPFQNGLFLRLLTAWFINGLANGLPAVCLPLYLTYILGMSETDRSLLIFTYFIFAILGIPLWMKLCNIVDKHKVWGISMLVACAAFLLVPLLDKGDLLAFGLICAVTGFTLGSDLVLPQSLQADCADWDRYKFRQNRTATLYSYWSMSTKLALGCAVGLAFPVLEWSGLALVPSHADQILYDISHQAKIALIVIYSQIPIVLKILAVALVWHFPFTRKAHGAVSLALEKR